MRGIAPRAEMWLDGTGTETVLRPRVLSFGGRGDVRRSRDGRPRGPLSRKRTLAPSPFGLGVQVPAASPLSGVLGVWGRGGVGIVGGKDSGPKQRNQGQRRTDEAERPGANSLLLD